MRGIEKLNSAITAAAIADAALAKGDLALAQTWIEKSLDIGKKTLPGNPARQVLLLTYAEVLIARLNPKKASQLLDDIDLQSLRSTAETYPWEARLSIVKACLLPKTDSSRRTLLEGARAILLPNATDYTVQMQLLDQCSQKA